MPSLEVLLIKALLTKLFTAPSIFPPFGFPFLIKYLYNFFHFAKLFLIRFTTNENGILGKSIFARRDLVIGGFIHSYHFSNLINLLIKF